MTPGARKRLDALDERLRAIARRDPDVAELLKQHIVGAEDLGYVLDRIHGLLVFNGCVDRELPPTLAGRIEAVVGMWTPPRPAGPIEMLGTQHVDRRHGGPERVDPEAVVAGGARYRL